MESASCVEMLRVSRAVSEAAERHLFWALSGLALMARDGCKMCLVQRRAEIMITPAFSGLLASQFVLCLPLPIAALQHAQTPWQTLSKLLCCKLRRHGAQEAWSRV